MNTEGALGRPSGHLSSETLDLLALSALEEPAKEQAKAHIDACGSCRTRLSHLEEDRERFTRFVFPRTLSGVEERAKRTPLWERVKQKWTLALPPLGFALATVLLMVVVPRTVTEPDDYLGVKGQGSRMDVVALRGDRQLPVGNDTTLAPGDRIRFLVDPAGAAYVLVASRDGEGNITVYYPYEGALSAQLQPGFQALPGAIELDRVGGRETVFAVFSDSPLQADEVRRALEAGADLAGLPGVRDVVKKEFVKDAP